MGIRVGCFHSAKKFLLSIWSILFLHSVWWQDDCNFIPAHPFSSLSFLLFLFTVYNKAVFLLSISGRKKDRLKVERVWHILTCEKEASVVTRLDQHVSNIIGRRVSHHICLSLWGNKVNLIIPCHFGFTWKSSVDWVLCIHRGQFHQHACAHLLHANAVTLNLYVTNKTMPNFTSMLN